jgi:hypothetical protein
VDIDLFAVVACNFHVNKVNFVVRIDNSHARAKRIENQCAGWNSVIACGVRQIKMDLSEHARQQSAVSIVDMNFCKQRS